MHKAKIRLCSGTKEEPSYKEVNGIIVNEFFGIHKEVAGPDPENPLWVVAHLPSGFSVTWKKVRVGFFVEPQQARRYADYLMLGAESIDWDHRFPEILQEITNGQEDSMMDAAKSIAKPGKRSAKALLKKFPL